jgi:hypothetical protein
MDFTTLASSSYSSGDDGVMPDLLARVSSGLITLPNSRLACLLAGYRNYNEFGVSVMAGAKDCDKPWDGT